MQPFPGTGRVWWLFALVCMHAYVVQSWDKKEHSACMEDWLAHEHITVLQHTVTVSYCIDTALLFINSQPRSAV